MMIQLSRWYISIFDGLFFFIFPGVNLASSQFVKSENVKDLKQESTQLDSKATRLEIPECA